MEWHIRLAISAIRYGRLVMAGVLLVLLALLAFILSPPSDRYSKNDLASLSRSPFSHFILHFLHNQSIEQLPSARIFRVAEVSRHQRHCTHEPAVPIFVFSLRCRTLMISWQVARTMKKKSLPVYKNALYWSHQRRSWVEYATFPSQVCAPRREVFLVGLGCLVELVDPQPMCSDTSISKRISVPAQSCSATWSYIRTVRSHALPVLLSFLFVFPSRREGMVRRRTRIVDRRSLPSIWRQKINKKKRAEIDECQPFLANDDKMVLTIRSQSITRIDDSKIHKWKERRKKGYEPDNQRTGEFHWSQP